MTHGVVSAGYEGRSIEEFVAALQELEVGTVADVRLNAISRNACFSKSRLREALASAGIGYRHLRSLGNAKENRQPFWTGRVEEGRRVFREALHVPEAEAELHELAELTADHVVPTPAGTIWSMASTHLVISGANQTLSRNQHPVRCHVR